MLQLHTYGTPWKTIIYTPELPLQKAHFKFFYFITAVLLIKSKLYYKINFCHIQPQIYTNLLPIQFTSVKSDQLTSTAKHNQHNKHWLYLAEQEMHRSDPRKQLK